METSTANRPSDRSDFYGRAADAKLAPLWHVLKGMVPKEPQTAAIPQVWEFDKVRPFLIEACELIGTAEAERRVLMLENEGLPEGGKITASLYAGLQIIQPGETAPPHRHAASALRFVIEGSQGWTAVAGEKSFMEPGDFVVTPAWEWHDHGNDGDGPMIWMDLLDVHIVNLLGCGFREDPEERGFVPERPPAASHFETGMNLLPMDADRNQMTSPIFNYPYSRTREALDNIARFKEIDPYSGFKLRYANPLNGDWAIGTIATWMQLLPGGFSTAPFQSTDGTVHVVVEGKGHSVVCGERLEWRKGDVFAVPAWAAASHHPDGEAVLFGASDRATQEKLGLWRGRPA